MSAAGTGWERVVCVSLFNHSWSTFALWGVAILEHNSEVGGGLTQEERKALAQGSPSLEGIPNKNQRAFTWVHTTWWQRKDFFFFFFHYKFFREGSSSKDWASQGLWFCCRSFNVSLQAGLLRLPDGLKLTKLVPSPEAVLALPCAWNTLPWLSPAVQVVAQVSAG